MNCGVCLMERVEVVPLGPDKKCPKCGEDYSGLVDDREAGTAPELLPCGHTTAEHGAGACPDVDTLPCGCKKGQHPAAFCPAEGCTHTDEQHQQDGVDAECVGNSHGYICPCCKRGDCLKVAATIWAALLPDGTDSSDSDTEWDSDSGALCTHCHWDGTAGQLVELEGFNA